MKKVGRNDPCPCGSGLKYKKCCMLKEQQRNSFDNLRKIYFQRYKIRLKEEKDIEKIKKAGELVVKTLELVEEFIKPGTKTDEINKFVYEFTVENGGYPAPLNYNGFPKSVCVSVNDEVCHGIPGDRILKEGDIVNVDVTTRLDGYYADASKTFFVGEVGDDAKKIVNVARECLKRGLAQVAPGKTIGDIGWSIQRYAEKNGCSVVREMVGHGVGFEFHEPPQVPHFGKKGRGIILVPGMVFTIEPMINLGKKDIKVLKDKWTVVTKDGSLSAQFEQTVAVTLNGYEVLTPYEL